MYLCMSCQIKFCVVTRHTTMLEIPLVLWGPFYSMAHSIGSLCRTLFSAAKHEFIAVLIASISSLVLLYHLDLLSKRGLLALQLLVVPWSGLSRVRLHSVQQYLLRKRPFRNKMRLVAWTLSLLPLALALPQITRQGKYLFDPSGNRFFIKVGMHRRQRECMRTHD